MTLEEIEYKEKLQRLSFTLLRKNYKKLWVDTYGDSWIIPTRLHEEEMYVQFICPKLCRILREALGVEHPTALLFCLEFYHTIKKDYEEENID